MCAPWPGGKTQGTTQGAQKDLVSCKTDLCGYLWLTGQLQGISSSEIFYRGPIIFL